MVEMAAHLRRSIALMEWVQSSHPDARVSIGPATLGSWKEVAPRWRLFGNRLRLQIRCHGRELAFWALSVQPAGKGATIRILGRAGHGLEAIHVTWREPPTSQRDSCDMMKAARAWAAEILPGCRIVSASRAADRAHTLSGACLRLMVRRGNADHLVLACSAEGHEEMEHAILTQGLLWLTLLRARRQLEGVPAIYLLVPVGRADVLFHRCRLVNSERVRVQVWECREGDGDSWEFRQPDPPAPLREDRDFRWPVLGPFRWSPLLARVMDLAPSLIQRYPRFQDYDSLRLLGLEFARVMGPDRDRILFGVGPHQTELTEDNFAGLRALVDEIVFYRRPDSPATDHPLYRTQAERWLECLLLRDVGFLFPELVPGSVYPQIPVYLGKVPGRVDILGADREGRLVVMELKVAEDPDMPLQSLDYWGRVIGHNLNGDFERRCYFPGIRLSRARPRIYLVSPVFSFHDSLEHLLRCLDPDMEVSKIAINEDWRCGVKILRRTNYRCGDLE
jgi:hypothetical protein